MHGVRKTLSSDEERKSKQIEQQRKIKIYKAARDRLFSKQKIDEPDDETLELTAKMLEKNPDISTFWNMRRRALLKMMSNNTHKQNDTQTGIDTDYTQTQDLLQNELRVTEMCLMVNPKSYGAWHHRAWTIEHEAAPDYDREIKLCDKALLLDERNFHCWDYRRFITGRAGTSDEKEIQFSNQKLQHNFSNYSAWHYRSTLLARTEPDPLKQTVVNADTMAKELKLVKNAFYTDPKDQSAWLYTDWLLQKPKNANEVVSAAVCVSACNQSELLICLLYPVELVELSKCITLNHKNVNGTWRLLPEDCSCSELVVFKTDAECEWNGCVVSNILHEHTNMAFHIPTDIAHSFVNQDALRESLGLATKRLPAPLRVLCGDLLSTSTELMELESDAIWPCLQAVSCLRALSVDGEHEQRVHELLGILQQNDPARTHYYQQMREQCLMGAAVCRERLLHPNAVQLRELQLSALPQVLCLNGVTDLDLSANQLSSVRSLAVLSCLQHLTLNENKLSDLDGLGQLSRLQFLSLASNQLERPEQFKELQGLQALTRLVYCENSVCEHNERVINIAHMMGDKCRCIPFWL